MVSHYKRFPNLFTVEIVKTIADPLNKNTIFVFINYTVYSIFNVRSRTPSGTRADHSLGSAGIYYIL